LFSEVTIVLPAKLLLRRSKENDITKSPATLIARRRTAPVSDEAQSCRCSHTNASEPWSAAARRFNVPNLCLSVCSALTLIACHPAPDTSILPSTNGNHRPWISLGHQVVADGALDKVETETIDTCTVNGGCAFTVHATRHTKVRLIGKVADASAGIKSVKLTIAKATAPDQPLQTYQVTHSLDANGKAPSEFGFAGTDNLGAFGLQSAIELEVHEYMQASLEVTNFENNTNRLNVVFAPHDPITASLSVSPAQIERGQTAFLSIGQSPMTTHSINPPTMTFAGGATVAPLTTTTYTLTVTQPFPYAKVGFPNPPPAVGQTVHPTSTTRTATLTVKQPATPSANPTEDIFYLALQDVGFASTYGWSLQFGLNTTGNILSIKNLGPYPIELIAQGKSTDDCFEGSDATVPLAIQGSTTATEITKLYGSPAQYPRGLAACAVIPPGNQPPQLLSVLITYTW
jgi:hypothetical protein